MPRTTTAPIAWFRLAQSCRLAFVARHSRSHSASAWAVVSIGQLESKCIFSAASVIDFGQFSFRNNVTRLPMKFPALLVQAAWPLYAFEVSFSYRSLNQFAT